MSIQSFKYSSAGELSSRLEQLPAGLLAKISKALPQNDQINLRIASRHIRFLDVQNTPSAGCPFSQSSRLASIKMMCDFFIGDGNIQKALKIAETFPYRADESLILKHICMRLIEEQQIEQALDIVLQIASPFVQKQVLQRIFDRWVEIDQVDRAFKKAVNSDSFTKQKFLECIYRALVRMNRVDLGIEVAAGYDEFFQLEVKQGICRVLIENKQIDQAHAVALSVSCEREQSKLLEGVCRAWINENQISSAIEIAHTQIHSGESKAKVMVFISKACLRLRCYDRALDIAEGIPAEFDSQTREEIFSLVRHSLILETARIEATIPEEKKRSEVLANISKAFFRLYDDRAWVAALQIPDSEIRTSVLTWGINLYIEFNKTESDENRLGMFQDIYDILIYKEERSAAALLEAPIEECSRNLAQRDN